MHELSWIYGNINKLCAREGKCQREGNTLVNPPMLHKIQGLGEISHVIPSEVRFLLVFSRGRMASECILHVASKRLLLLGTTTPALIINNVQNGPLSSREFTLARLLQFCWIRLTPRGQFLRRLK